MHRVFECAECVDIARRQCLRRSRNQSLQVQRGSPMSNREACLGNGTPPLHSYFSGRALSSSSFSRLCASTPANFSSSPTPVFHRMSPKSNKYEEVQQRNPRIPYKRKIPFSWNSPSACSHTGIERCASNVVSNNRLDRLCCCC